LGFHSCKHAVPEITSERIQALSVKISHSAGPKAIRMNVSLPDAMEEFVRQKVAVGDYETASEVVREGLRLLKQRDEVWKAAVQSKIKQSI
jgi:putative addiction module CopG family antidote